MSSTPRKTEEERAVEQAAAWLVSATDGERLAGSDGRGREWLRKWLRSDRRNAVALEGVTRVWAATGQLRDSPKLAREIELARKIGELRKDCEAARIDAEPARAGWRWQFKLAGVTLAAAVFIGVASIWLFRPIDQLTARGESRSVTLSDGSRILLNTDTAVSVRYGLLERRVRLERGEAEFDVARSRLRPFIVQAQGVEVRALGTRFVVRETGRETVVLLVEGRVALSGQQGRALAQLTAGQKVIARPDRLLIPVSPFDPDRELAWREGRLVLERATLREALAEFRRYSNADVVLEGSEVGQLKVSGVFGVGDLEAFLAAAARIHDLEVHAIAANQLILRSRHK